MEASLSPTMNIEDAEDELKSQTPPTKKRKVKVEKRVVRVRIGGETGKEKSNEGPPSDSWSWRKYGQKPIKGSPYPRGYYRCSTSKGCSAKKQVERCKSDASVLIITYTSSHNHPERISSVHQNPKEIGGKSQIPHDRKEPQEHLQESPSQNQEPQEIPNGTTVGAEDSHYSKDLQFGEVFTMSQLGTVISMESCRKNERPTKTEVEEEDEEYYDFFDELEELHPTINLFSYGFQEGYQDLHQLVR